MPLDLDLEKGAKGQKSHAWAAYFTLHPRPGHPAPLKDWEYGDKNFGVVKAKAAKYVAKGRRIKKFWIAKELADFIASKQALGGSLEDTNTFLEKLAATGCRVVIATRLKAAADAAMKRVGDMPAAHINKIAEIKAAAAEAVKAPVSDGGIAVTDAEAHARAEKLQADRQRPALVIKVPAPESAQQIVMTGGPGEIRHERIVPVNTRGLLEMTEEKKVALEASRERSREEKLKEEGGKPLTEAEKAARKKMRERWDKVKPQYVDASDVIMDRIGISVPKKGTKLISALPEDLDAEHKPISALLTLGRGPDIGLQVSSQGFYPRFYTANFSENAMLWGGNDPETTLAGKRPILDLGFLVRDLRKEWDRPAWNIADKVASRYGIDARDVQYQLLDAVEDWAKVYDPSLDNPFHVYVIGKMEGYAKNIVRTMWEIRAPDEAELGPDPGDEPSVGMARMPSPEEEYAAKEAESKVPGFLGSATDVTERMDTLLDAGKFNDAADLVIGARAEVAKDWSEANERMKEALYDKHEAERAYQEANRKFPKDHKTVDAYLAARDDERAAYARMHARGEVHRIVQEHQRTGTPTDYTVDAVRPLLSGVVASHWLSPQEGAVLQTALRFGHRLKQSTEIETTDLALAARGNGMTPLKLPTPHGQPQRYLAATVTGISGKEHNLLPSAKEIVDALVAVGHPRQTSERDWPGYWNKAIEKLDRMPKSQRDAMREVLVHARNLALGKRREIEAAQETYLRPVPGGLADVTGRFVVAAMEKDPKTGKWVKQVGHRSRPTVKLRAVESFDAEIEKHDEQIKELNAAIKVTRVESRMHRGQARVEGDRLRALVNMRAEKIAAAEGFPLWSNERPEDKVVSVERWGGPKDKRTLKIVSETVKPPKEKVGGKARYYVEVEKEPQGSPEISIGQAAYKLARSKTDEAKLKERVQKVGASYENTSEYDIRRTEIFDQAYEELAAEDPTIRGKSRRFRELHSKVKKLETKIESLKKEVAHHEVSKKNLRVARESIVTGAMAPHDPNHLIWRLQLEANKLRRANPTTADRAAARAFDRMIQLKAKLDTPETDWDGKPRGPRDPTLPKQITEAALEAKVLRDFADSKRHPAISAKLKEYDAAIEKQRAVLRARKEKRREEASKLGDTTHYILVGPKGKQVRYATRQNIVLPGPPEPVKKSLSSLVGDYLEELINLDRVVAWI